ncbi:MAG: hypothetical protein Fur0021_20570 [Candidatus Promineifilaceae bacterium]
MNCWRAAAKCNISGMGTATAMTTALGWQVKDCEGFSQRYRLKPPLRNGYWLKPPLRNGYRLKPLLRNGLKPLLRNGLKPPLRNGK